MNKMIKLTGLTDPEVWVDRTIVRGMVRLDETKDTDGTRKYPSRTRLECVLGTSSTTYLVLETPEEIMRLAGVLPDGGWAGYFAMKERNDATGG